jgi:hypothetical protein
MKHWHGRCWFWLYGVLRSGDIIEHGPHGLTVRWRGVMPGNRYAFLPFDSLFDPREVRRG